MNFDFSAEIASLERHISALKGQLDEWRDEKENNTHGQAAVADRTMRIIERSIALQEKELEELREAANR